MRRILNPSFPLPLTYVCCFSCSYCCFSCSMGQNNRNKFAPNQVKLKIATSLASGQSAPTSFCFPFHSCLCPPCLAIFLHPNFNRPIPSQKWILKLLKQQRIPLNMPKHSTKIPCQCTKPLPSPRQSHSQNDPKTLPGPRPAIVGRIHLWPPQRSAARPRRHGPSAAASCSAVKPRAPRMRPGLRGSCSCHRETKRSSHNGMFLRVVGQKNMDRSYIDRK